jgi:uncharacterized damage-inducible protein DinB
MTEIERICQELRRGWDGDAWHGPPLHELLAGISAAQAAAHPVAGAHGIWELVLHMAAWKGEVRRRLEGSEPGEPLEGDWPPVGDSSEAAWAEARRTLGDAHEALERVVQGMTPAELALAVGAQRDRITGAGRTRFTTVLGILQHDAYHGGQIALLRRALSTARSR